MDKRTGGQVDRRTGGQAYLQNNSTGDKRTKTNIVVMTRRQGVQGKRKTKSCLQVGVTCGGSRAFIQDKVLLASAPVCTLCDFVCNHADQCNTALQCTALRCTTLHSCAHMDSTLHYKNLHCTASINTTSLDSGLPMHCKESSLDSDS